MCDKNDVNIPRTLAPFSFEGDIFLTEEKQGLFSSDQAETNYEDSENYNLGFENAIMEVHMKYDLRSKNNQETSKRSQRYIAVRKTP